MLFGLSGIYKCHQRDEEGRIIKIDKRSVTQNFYMAAPQNSKKDDEFHPKNNCDISRTSKPLGVCALASLCYRDDMCSRFAKLRQILSDLEMYRKAVFNKLHQATEMEDSILSQCR